MGLRSYEDTKKAELQERYPGWRIWYVPAVAGHGGYTWCARPLPLINTGSPEELAEEIRRADLQTAARLSEGLGATGDTRA